MNITVDGANVTTTTDKKPENQVSKAQSHSVIEKSDPADSESDSETEAADDEADGPESAVSESAEEDAQENQDVP